MVGTNPLTFQFYQITRFLVRLGLPEKTGLLTGSSPSILLEMSKGILWIRNRLQP